MAVPCTTASAVANPVAQETVAASTLYSPNASAVAEMIFVLTAKMVTSPATVCTLAPALTVTVAAELALVTSTEMPNGVPDSPRTAP